MQVCRGTSARIVVSGDCEFIKCDKLGAYTRGADKKVEWVGEGVVAALPTSQLAQVTCGALWAPWPIVRRVFSVYFIRSIPVIIYLTPN